MTINRDSNPPPRTHRPAGDGTQPHERREAGRMRTGEELDPRNDRGQGSERTESQGRGNEPDKA